MIGNARHMHRHRAVVTAIHEGHNTIPKIGEATGIEESQIRTSISYTRSIGLIETLPDKFRFRAQYRLVVPLAAAMGALPIELPAPEFEALESAFGIPPEIASTIALQAAPRIVEGVGIRRA